MLDEKQTLDLDNKISRAFKVSKLQVYSYLAASIMLVFIGFCGTILVADYQESEQSKAISNIIVLMSTVPLIPVLIAYVLNRVRVRACSDAINALSNEQWVSYYTSRDPIIKNRIDAVFGAWHVAEQLSKGNCPNS